MNLSNQKEIKKDVCSKPIISIGQTNLDRYVLLESPKKKVTYRVTKQISDIFSAANYQKIFKLLSLIENQLTEPLAFTVELDYITLEAFKRSCEEDKNGYVNLKNRLGTKVFELINDISIRKSTMSSEEIQDNYLCDNDLDMLKEYYEKYHDIVMDCFGKNYSSLVLFDILYKGKAPASFLSNIYRAIKDENECEVRKDFASRLLIEYLTEMSAYDSERVREELSYQMSEINKKFDKLDCQKLSSISNDMRLVIDHVYSLL